MAVTVCRAKTSSLMLGFCLPSLRHNASKIKVPLLDFDNYLLMHFKKFIVLHAHDPLKMCKSGDLVLIEELPKRLSTSITHKVVEVVLPCGDITDPITGKKVVGSKYRDEIDFIDSLFGKSASIFDYEKAPKRGWQENKKDFTHREPYVKYHEFDDGDENKDQPFSVSY